MSASMVAKKNVGLGKGPRVSVAIFDEPPNRGQAPQGLPGPDPLSVHIPSVTAQDILEAFGIGEW